MLWVSWRQTRAATLAASAMIALLAAYILPVGSLLRDSFTSTGLASCLHSSHPYACGQTTGAFLKHANSLGQNMIPWLNFAPGLIGALIGASLIASEFEQGTHRLAWVQSVTRRRWLFIRLGVAALVATAAAAAFALLMAYWRSPFDQLAGRFDPNAFDFEGPVVIAYTLFAFALAVLLGALTRRTVPAIVGTLVGYFAVRLSVENFLRPHYLTPISQRLNGANADNYLSHTHAQDWLLQRAVFGHPNSTVVDHVNITYQPASRYWAFQTIESTIFLALAAALTAATMTWLTRASRRA